MRHRTRRQSFANENRSVNPPRSVISAYRVGLRQEPSIAASSPTPALLASYAITPPQSATLFAHQLVDAIEGDPLVLHDVLLATADRQDPAVRSRRADLLNVVLNLLTCCFHELLSLPEGRTILEDERRRQELGLTLGAKARSNPTERAIVRMSDLVAQLRDPAYRTAKRRRRTGLFRRPDGMPFFYPASPIGRTGVYVRAIDVREWQWLDLEVYHLVDGDGQVHDELGPVSDCHSHGIVVWNT